MQHKIWSQNRTGALAPSTMTILTKKWTLPAALALAWALVLALVLASLSGCKSNPNKAEPVETKLDRAAPVTGDEKVGLKNGEMVVLDKVQIAEKLRDLQNAVYSLEDRVYGTRKLGSLGLYGDLKDCERKLASRRYGGSGSLTWTEPLDRVTDKEDDLKVGLDEQQDLVGVNQEYLLARLARFNGYKMILQKRSDEFEEKIQNCKAELADRKADSAQSTKVMVTEVQKATADKVAISVYMCSYVKPGADLKTLMIDAFSHGWLSVSDFSLDQNLLVGPVKDMKGEAQDHAFLFNGWKLAFDSSPVSVGDILKEGKNAKLVAWAFDHKAEVAMASSCLKAGDGEWNKQ